MTFSDGFPPFYPERSSPAILGNDTIYLIYSACVLLVAILLLLPGFKSYEVRMGDEEMETHRCVCLFSFVCVYLFVCCFLWMLFVFVLFVCVCMCFCACVCLCLLFIGSPLVVTMVTTILLGVPKKQDK